RISHHSKSATDFHRELRWLLRHRACPEALAMSTNSTAEGSHWQAGGAPLSVSASQSSMSQVGATTLACEPSASDRWWLRDYGLVAEPGLTSGRQPVALPLDFVERVLRGIKRRWARERRRRKVARAYDMALEIARVIPYGSEVLDVGCGNGFIAHHLSAMLGTRVVGIDVTTSTEAAIEYRHFDGIHFPLEDDSFD